MIRSDLAGHHLGGLNSPIYHNFLRIKEWPGKVPSHSFFVYYFSLAKWGLLLDFPG